MSIYRKKIVAIKFDRLLVAVVKYQIRFAFGTCRMKKIQNNLLHGRDTEMIIYDSALSGNKHNVYQYLAQITTSIIRE